MHSPVVDLASGAHRTPGTLPIAILDFGSQYTQLIARRVRERQVYCEILPYHTPAKALAARGVRGVVLSGGPMSLLDPEAPLPDPALLELGVPLLGLCYGMGVLATLTGGRLARGSSREFGLARVQVRKPEAPIFGGLKSFQAWMSHGDSVVELPSNWQALAATDDCEFAAARHRTEPWYALQFHPEVAHTQDGGKLLDQFVYTICEAAPEWTMERLEETAVESIRRQAPAGGVLCALSGGVDSSVAAVLAHRAVGERLTCVFVDHGLLRQGEAETVTQALAERFGLKVIHAQRQALFLERLADVLDPEEKRQRIGHTFIEVFEQEAVKLDGIRYLVQGTLYPDVIESAGVLGPASTIKSHHNVGGLPERMGLELIEPLRELFKDEVRELGRVLAIPESIIGRHPFPGPGLAIRIMGPVTPESLAIVRQADHIFIEELRTRRLYDEVWQALCVLLPVQTVGVMGDERTYERIIALRAVTSVDGMTADWARLPAEALSRIAGRIVNEVRGVNRVVYDLSSKPPATIEWE